LYLADLPEVPCTTETGVNWSQNSEVGHAISGYIESEDDNASLLHADLKPIVHTDSVNHHYTEGNIVVL